MRASLFNVPVPLAGGDDVFLMNTLSDAQAVVSREVADVLARLRETDVEADLPADTRAALETLAGEGFLVESHDAEREAVQRQFAALREDASELRVTVLTTLQCNFACDYCVQGDHGPGSGRGQRMSLDTAAQVLAWIEERLDRLSSSRMVLTFFGGEPLLNLPAVYFLAERCASACRTRSVPLSINVITNGLLLSDEVVDRLLPFGLNGIKVTLDGAREAHDRQRPLRGGQGTFDRIVDNVRRVAGRCRVAIGGNVEAGSTGAFVELLDYLASQAFAPALDKVTFKPVMRPKAATPPGIIPLRLVGSNGAAPPAAANPRAHAHPSSPCDTCHFVDEEMAALREATRARGFRTLDGVHMGPCELHRRHAYTVGPDGALYACPGFSGESDLAVGHVDGRADARQTAAAERFARISPWRDACGDCAFVPVCGGGCSVASHVEQHDLAAPSCHKSSFESGVIALAREAVPGA